MKLLKNQGAERVIDELRAGLVAGGKRMESAANLADSLKDSVEHLKTDRTEQDILFELLLKLGLDLCVPIVTKKIATSA